MDEISNPNNDPPKISLIQPKIRTHRRDKREDIDIVRELRRSLSHSETCRRTDANEEANRAFYKMTFVRRTNFRHSLCRSVYKPTRVLRKVGALVAGDVNAGERLIIGPITIATAASGHRNDNTPGKVRQLPDLLVGGYIPRRSYRRGMFKLC
jgi:hypothetical protein